MTEQLTATPGQTVGPFFHDALPYQRGHQLVPPATPGAVRLHGTVRDGLGNPVPDALVEVRQAAPDGTHPRAEGSLRREGVAFTGWGRAATDAAGRYSFITLEPGADPAGGAAFFSLAVFARGLLNRLFTRAYVPGSELAAEPLLRTLDEERRRTLVAVREESGDLRFDIHLQGEAETVFLAFPGHGDR